MKYTLPCLLGLALVVCLWEGNTSSRAAEPPGDKLLPHGAVRQLGSEQLRHPTAQSAVYSPDGTVLVSGGSEMRFWDVKTRRLLRTIALPERQEDGDAFQLRFAADGKTLFALVTGHAVLAFDVATGKRLFRLKPDGMDISAFDIAPDGQTLATGSQRGEVILWKTATREKLRALTGHRRSARFQANAAQDPHAWLLSIHSLAFSPDGKWLASSSIYDDAVRVWDVVTGQEKHVLRRHEGQSSQVGFSPDGALLAACSYPTTDRDPRAKPVLTLWDVATGKVHVEFEDSNGYALAFSPDGKWVASGGGLCQFRVYERGTGKVRFTSPRLAGAVCTLMFAQDGRTMLSCSSSLDVWEVPTFRNLLADDGHTGTIRAVAISPDGNTIASGGNDAIVRLWDAATGKLRHRIDAHGGVTSLAFSPDGRTLAFGAYLSSDLHLWDVTTGKEVRRMPMEHYVTHVGFSPDGKIVAAATILDLKVHFLEPATGKEVRQISWSYGLDLSCHHHFGLSPDGRHYAGIHSLDGSKFSVGLWDMTKGQEPRLFSGEARHFTDLTFSPDGEYLAWADADVHVWDVREKKMVHTLKGKGTCGLAFSPDGHYLAAGRTLHPLTPKRPALKLPMETSCLAFSRDGKVLAAVPQDGCTVMLFEVGKLGQ